VYIVLAGHPVLYEPFIQVNFGASVVLHPPPSETVQNIKQSNNYKGSASI
jgi:hypothetical protein